MKRKGSFDNIIILALICLIVISSVSLDTVFSYFSDKTGTEGNTTMGYIELVSLTNLDGSEIGDAENLDSDQTFTGEYKLVTNTNINYYVYIFLKGTITPDGDKTHDTSCTDYYADDTDCLDITVNGYSKLDTKSTDGYTIYYKLCTIQTAGQNTQTFSITASIKTDLVENGCDYYDNATILFDMKVKTKQADYLQANEYTLGFSSPLVNKDLCSIGFIVPVQDVSKYPNLTFTVTDSNAKTMSIAPADTSITEVNIPYQVEMNGEIYTITSIPDNAFGSCKNLTTVTISEGVTHLSEMIFQGCTSLTSVTLPSSLVDIDEGSFSGCTSLASINLPEGLTEIKMEAFSNCTGLTSITIPSSVTSILNSAFYNCTGLTSITISNGVVGYRAFYGCTNLTSVILDGVIEIGANAFAECTSLTSITIPDSVTSIGDFAFYNCTNLTSMTILSDKIKFGQGVVYSGWTNLQYNIYDNGKYLGNDDNPYLALMEAVDTSITSCEVHPNCKLIVSPFDSCSALTSITIPEGVTSIGRSAFNNCSSLTSITIPNSVTSIGDYVFYGCTKLTSITIPNTVTSIGDYVFYGCTALTSITIPNAVTSIGRDVFRGCRSLTSITIPSSVTSIGGGGRFMVVLD